MKKLIDNKKISYLIVMSLFAVVCMLRFFDREISEHEVLLSVMNEYAFAIVMTFIYIIAFVVLVCVSLYKIDDSKIKNVYYLYAMIGVFVFSMYWNEDYLGVNDIYSYLFMFIGLVLVINNQYLYLIPILNALGCFVSPISIVSSQVLMVMIILIRFSETKDSILKRVVIIDILAVMVAMIIRCVFFGFDIDAVGDISVSRVVSMLVLFVPFYYLYGRVFNNVKHNKMYFIAMIAGLIGPVFEGIVLDPARAIFYGFTYYLFLITILYVCGNKDTVRAVDDVEGIIKKYIDWPGILPAYLFVIITFWISGPLKLFKEIIISK